MYKTQSGSNLQPSPPRQDRQPGQHYNGPGQDRPGQAEAETVENTEGNVGLSSVGCNCISIVYNGDWLHHDSTQQVGGAEVGQNETESLPQHVILFIDLRDDHKVKDHTQDGQTHV